MIVKESKYSHFNLLKDSLIKLQNGNLTKKSEPAETACTDSLQRQPADTAYRNCL